MLERCARAIYAAANHRVVQTTRSHGMPEASEEYPLLWENGGMYHAEAYRSARAVMAELWSAIDLALLDFDDRDPDPWARGHAHAKSVVRDKFRTALSQPNEEGEGK